MISLNIKEIIELLINGIKYGYQYIVNLFNTMGEVMGLLQRHSNQIAASTQNIYLSLGIMSVFLIAVMRVMFKKGAN